MYNWFISDGELLIDSAEQGCGAGVKDVVGVDQSRPAGLESGVGDSGLEPKSAKFCRLQSGIGNYILSIDENYSRMMRDSQEKIGI